MLTPCELHKAAACVALCGFFTTTDAVADATPGEWLDRMAGAVSCVAFLVLVPPVIATEIDVSFPADLESGVIDGRIILMLSPDADEEWRAAIAWGMRPVTKGPQ